MLGYVARRVGTSVLLLALVSVLIFVVLRLLPGDPALARIGSAQNIDPAAVARLREDLGLDRPILAQYVSWVSGILRGDAGRSYFSDFGVWTLLSQRLGATLLLALAGLVLGVLIAVPLALAPELWPQAFVGRFVSWYATVGMAAPPFLFGIILIAIFSVQLGLFPNRGYVPLNEDPVESIRLLAMPALTLAIGLSAPLIRYLRASMHEALMSPYVRTAIGKGVPYRRVVVRHALPNALLPALTLLGVMVGSLLGGVVVVEHVFRWPGMGSLIVTAVLKRDYALLQTSVLLAAAAFIIVNLLVDIAYGLLDPRLRVGRARS